MIELIEECVHIDQTYSGDRKYSEFFNDDYYLGGATLLMFAIFYRDLGIMKYLLDNGADPHIEDDNGLNSFLWACGVGNVDVIKMIVEADPDLVNSLIHSRNGLHTAILYNNVEVFEYLVNDLGIDINSTDEDDNGVLYYAANEDEALEKLRELGAEE